MREITVETPEKDLPSFWVAEEPKEIASSIIKENHQARLGQAPILYLFRKKMKEAAKASARSPKERAISAALGVELDFLIEFDWSTWIVMDEESKEALVDHELTHCAYTDRGDEIVPTTIEHYIEEFPEIVERHGLWHSRLKKMADVMKRTTKPGEK